MKVIAVSGTKNTGKTTLVTRIVAELTRRGFSVGTIKHTHHTFDLEGKDTWKHREAGAEIVVGSGDETFLTVNENMDLDQILSMIKFIKDLDFVVLESFKHCKYAKVATSNIEDEFIITRVNALEMNENDVKPIVDLIEERSYGILQNLDCKKCGFENCTEFAKAVAKGEAKTGTECKTESDEILLRVDDRIIPMNFFVQDFVKNAVIGMIKSLKTEEFGVSEGKKIELIIRDKN
jgi:molybdopterin-guanine dinucleotide biosynthesis protein B